MENEKQESKLEKKSRIVGNLIQTKVKKGLELMSKAYNNIELHFLTYLLLSIGVGALGANESRKAREEYTGNNTLYERVQSINNKLNSNITFQYEDFGQLCKGAYRKQEEIQNLFSERDSITQLPTYQKQTEKIEQAKILREIGWGIPMFVGIGGTLLTLIAFGNYVKEERSKVKEKK